MLYRAVRQGELRGAGTGGLDGGVGRHAVDQLPRLLRLRGDQQAGLVVDNLIGQQEIVIKSLGKYINGNKLISGATILGDGDVALILDVNTLM